MGKKEYGKVFNPGTLPGREMSALKVIYFSRSNTWGYAIVQTINSCLPDGSPQFDIQSFKIYTVLNKLEKNGYILRSPGVTGGGNNVQFCSITKKGKDFVEGSLIYERRLENIGPVLDC